MVIEIYREELTQELMNHLIKIDSEELTINYRGKIICERYKDLNSETGKPELITWYNKQILDGLNIKYGL